LPLKKNSFPSIAIRFVDETQKNIDENALTQSKAPSPEKQALPEAIETTATSSSDSLINEQSESTEVTKTKKPTKHNMFLGKKKSK
jgi:hypothetical protein